MQGFDCRELLYTDYKQLPANLEKSLNCRYVPDVADMVKQCDIVTINCPLHKVFRRLDLGTRKLSLCNLS